MTHYLSPICANQSNHTTNKNRSNRYYRTITIGAALGLTLLVSACQKTPESETAADPTATPVTTNINQTDQDINAESINAPNANTEREDKLASLENNIGAEGVTPNAETTTPSPEQAIKGVQVTDVRYRSASGATLAVVFETSATGVLNAIVTLPNNTKMTLSAPEGQGNNPTYRSTDGTVELISHGGGSTIDLMQDDNVISFEAISAEAEVVTQP